MNQWKNKFLENASLAFDVGKATKGIKEENEELKRENDALAKKLGKTAIERDWIRTPLPHLVRAGGPARGKAKELGLLD